MPANVIAPLSSDGATCCTCRWWSASADQRAKVPYDSFRAPCRVRAPQADLRSLQAVWPTCQHDEWCGAWAALPETLATQRIAFKGG